MDDKTSLFTFTQINLHKAKLAASMFAQRFKERNTQIALISEPRHLRNKIIGLGDNNVIYSHNGSDVPRAAIVYKKGVNLSPLSQFLSPDLVAAELSLKIDNIDTNKIVASGYHDGNKSVVPDLSKLVKFCEDSGKQLIYCCDSNAHNAIWGSSKTDRRGINLLNYVASQDLTIVNKMGKSTLFAVKKRQNSTHLMKIEDVGN